MTQEENQNPNLKKIGKSFEQTFYQRRYMNGQQMQKQMLNAFGPRKMRCKTMRYCHTPTRMAKIKNTENVRCQQGWGEGNTLVVGI